MHFEMGVLLRPEYISNKLVHSCTPDHPVLGVQGKTPHDCFLSLMNKHGLGSDEAGAVFTPLPHVVTRHERFDLQGEKEPWRWQSPFQGQDNFGETCDGNFQKYM